MPLNSKLRTNDAKPKFAYGDLVSVKGSSRRWIVAEGYGEPGISGAYKGWRYELSDGQGRTLCSDERRMVMLQPMCNVSVD